MVFKGVLSATGSFVSRPVVNYQLKNIFSTLHERNILAVLKTFTMPPFIHVFMFFFYLSQSYNVKMPHKIKLLLHVKN